MKKLTLFERLALAHAASSQERLKVQLFNKIEGGVAIVRKPKAFLAQMELYSRGSQVFIKTGSGFLRISDKLGESEPYLTVHTDYKVLELEGTGIKLEGNKAPKFQIGWTQ